MPPKQQLDKSAWSWAETTDPSAITVQHIKTAYHLDLKPCKLGICKRNCKGNPFCLNSIGERVWFGEIDDRNWHDVDDPESERRKNGMFVGLKNLGATCYVNTFLQLWFHNHNVRKAIYQWRDPDFKKISSEEWSPNTICDHLQVIFAMLELSERRYIDPSGFINYLGLDAGQQQDAQEFSKLFLSLLEESLERNAVSTGTNIVPYQFQGKYAYVTRCSKCNNMSDYVSQFYELDLSIRGHKTLEDAINGFLEEEKLEGDNQYMCTVCQSKQNATRTIQLKLLPPVLNLQLLRFVFEKEAGHKKKLNSFIQFPDVLDMNKFTKDGTSALYDLSAVLIHRGPTAFSGHYIAHIKDQRSQAWFKFNDQEIEKMKGRNLQLGNEDDPQEAKQLKGTRTPKGYHSSRNAYMLVYIKKDAENRAENGDQFTTDVARQREKGKSQNQGDGKDKKSVSQDIQFLPSHVLNYVEQDNKKFEKWIEELVTMREKSIEKGKEKQENIKSIFSEMVCDSDNKIFEFMSHQWLTKWLSNPSKAGPIDNKPYLCKHGKIDPDSASKLKCIAEKGADYLYEKFGGGPRMQGENLLCELCVRKKCCIIRTKQQIAEDEKLISSSMKFSFDGQPCYWIGKSSFRSWRRLALENLGDYEKSWSKDLEEDFDQNEYSNYSPQSTEHIVKFNEDLLCEGHLKLGPDESSRRLIPELVWLRLKMYFPGCPEFTSDAPLCENCLNINFEEQRVKEKNKATAQEQKSALLDLFHDRKRPTVLKTDEQIFLVNSDFVDSWRRFVRDTGNKELVTDVLNYTLICEHAKFLYPPDPDGRLAIDDRVVYLYAGEWQVLQSFFSVDVEISLLMLKDEAGVEKVICHPEACEECVTNRLEQEERNKFHYKDAIIYIRKVAKGSEIASLGDDSVSEDPDFQQSRKRKDSFDSTDGPPDKISKLDTAEIRKSQRRRKVRGEKELKVSSNQTLKDLKIQVMKLFSVPPFDQNLSLNGTPLVENSETLSSLRIMPGSIIMLKADEPVEDPMLLEDMYAASDHQESGFKGTSLSR
ncbi:hypothetical protein CHS0354_004752 [Potamilus streckersoni]|uniref:Ubiquitin carboxyl-terminal hydrolase 48 n=1 Tax=Potamilus streckersoni TaxID=2493646 RepID=A0AAE0TDA1_9BIVA|nr:hypothetical protein CHS0354_004752 [Potamilus streckersoni]